MDATSSLKTFATIQFGRVHWIFQAEARPDFASYIQVKDVSQYPDIQEGWAWDEEADKPVPMIDEKLIEGLWPTLPSARFATHDELLEQQIVVKRVALPDIEKFVRDVNERDFGDAKLTGGGYDYVDKKMRSAEMNLKPQEYRGWPRLASLFWGMIADYEDLFHVRYHLLEQPQLIRYKEGGFFRPHLDGLGRKLTLLLYLNDDFEGGEIAFQRLGAKLKIEVGTLVAFPSTYAHAALPVTKGVKMAVLTWAR